MNDQNQQLIGIQRLQYNCKSLLESLSGVMLDDQKYPPLSKKYQQDKKIEEKDQKNIQNSLKTTASNKINTQLQINEQTAQVQKQKEILEKQKQQPQQQDEKIELNQQVQIQKENQQENIIRNKSIQDKQNQKVDNIQKQEEIAAKQTLNNDVKQLTELQELDIQKAQQQNNSFNQNQLNLFFPTIFDEKTQQKQDTQHYKQEEGKECFLDKGLIALLWMLEKFSPFYIGYQLNIFLFGKNKNKNIIN